VDAGQYGVFVFFLISGYIVPASLERRGSVRSFWVSRLFRLYPMYIVAIAFALLLWNWGQGGLRGAGQDPLNSVFAQFLMMGDVLAGPNVPNVVWSLTYEMAFYLLLTALFIAGIHRRSSWYALGFGVAALAFGGVLPKQLLSGNLAGPAVVSAVADLTILATLAGAILLRGKLRLVSAALAAGIAMLLLATNSHGNWVYPWEIPTILGLMFTGTALYRAEQGQYPWSRAIAVAVATVGMCIAAGLWHSQAWGIHGAPMVYWERRWFFSLALAALTFGGGLALRHWQMPKWLAWLGLISYSVYLLHPVLLEVLNHQVLHGHKYGYGAQMVIAVGFVLVLVGVSSVTYLLVERPAQQLGRRVARRLDARYGPDRLSRDAVGHAGMRASTEQQPADVPAAS
jgi:peptidoglycan/LPS O-acetylase OafA/YrhL